MLPEIWHGKPYYSLDAYCKNTFHQKCYKIALNAHMTCPNRDGLIDTRGCIFCSAGGSGDFAVSNQAPAAEGNTDAGFQVFDAACGFRLLDIQTQLANGLAFFGGKNVGNTFIAYFQAYTNTYAPVPYLRQVYTQALSSPDICGISVATRPDCLPTDVLALLASLKELFPDKFIWVELGLQSIHEETAVYIRRGYPLSTFEKALAELRALDIPVIVHIILGLPHETSKMQLQTIDYLNKRKIFGIKLQLLHILKDTDLAAEYRAGKVNVLEKDAYLRLLIQCLEGLSPEIVVHRVTGDGPKTSLLAPDWSRNKRDVLNTLHRLMKEQDSFQGKQFTF